MSRNEDGKLSSFLGKKMQKEVASHTMEGEHVALSQRTRDLAPTRHALACLNQFLKVNDRKISMFSMLFEDNEGAL